MSECRVIKSAIKHNYLQMSLLCKKNQADLNVVSKFCLSNQHIINFLYECNQFSNFIISDSNMENFTRLNQSFAKKITKCVIKTRISDIKRIPALPECYRPNRLFVSHFSLLEEIEKLPQRMQPEVVLITETGDMKDGFLPEEILSLCQKLPKINIIGISVNFSCLSGILPDMQTVKKLAELSVKVQKIRGLKKTFLSVGGTVVQSVCRNGELSKMISEIRSGEGIFFGYDSSSGCKLDGFIQKTIVLKGEILEVAQKDFALRKGHSAGFSATGETAETKLESGNRKRAVLDFGILCASQKDLVPVDEKILFAGQTFDFTVVDVTDSLIDYKPGMVIEFIENYGAASFSMMNRFICCSLGEE